MLKVYYLIMIIIIQFVTRQVPVSQIISLAQNLVAQCLVNHFREFHQIYNLYAVGDSDDI